MLSLEAFREHSVMSRRVPAVLPGAIDQLNWPAAPKTSASGWISFPFHDLTCRFTPMLTILLSIHLGREAQPTCSHHTLVSIERRAKSAHCCGFSHVISHAS